MKTPRRKPAQRFIQVVFTIPTWKQCEKKHDDKEKMTELERFIFEYEPADCDYEWRKHLEDVLAETVNEDRQGL